VPRSHGSTSQGALCNALQMIHSPRSLTVIRIDSAETKSRPHYSFTIMSNPVDNRLTVVLGTCPLAASDTF
jgi:hypothetical protein